MIAMKLSTASKVSVARWLSKTVLTYRRIRKSSPIVEVSRRGLRWALDLQEGIDLAIYLFGSFEPYTIRLYRRLLEPGSIVLDIGANIGAHTLPLAKLVGAQGKVIAFEPTRFAYGKLLRNIALNPGLGSIITPMQIMLAEKESSDLQGEIYSSWPLDSHDGVHAQHQGRLMSTQGACVSTIDNFLETNKIQSVDFVKLDVDGNELSVLAGGTQMLQHYRPSIIMELAPYVFSCSGDFDRMIGLLRDLGYQLLHIPAMKPLSLDPYALRAHIGEGASMNVLAKPT